MRNQASRGRPKHDDVLTPAEWRVVHAVKHGLTSRVIAESQGISVDAVKFHVANALGKLGLPDRKALRQWFEIPKNSALRDQEVQVPESLGPIGQIARTVSSVEQSRDWYQHALGLAHLYTFGGLAFFDCGGVRLALMQKNPVSDESILYLRTDNIGTAHERLKSLGVEFISAPHMVHRHADGTEEWVAFFKDLEGRPLALISQAAAGQGGGSQARPAFVHVSLSDA